MLRQSVGWSGPEGESESGCPAVSGAIRGRARL